MELKDENGHSECWNRAELTWSLNYDLQVNNRAEMNVDNIKRNKTHDSDEGKLNRNAQMNLLFQLNLANT